MEQDITRKRMLSAALVAVVAGAVAAPAAVATPPDHAPAHGVRGDAPPQQEAPPPAAPPAQAPAHGKRGTHPPKRHAAPKQHAAPKPKPKAKAKPHPVTPKQHAAPKPKAKQHESRSTPPAWGRHRQTICHATGSAKNPYVEITIATPGVLRGHEPHGDDIIPAPAGGCPGPTAAPVTEPQAAGGEAAGTASSESPVTPAGSPSVTPAEGIITSSQMGTTPAPKGRIQVLGEVETENGAPDTASDQPATAAREVSDHGLPFTGADLALIAIIGIAALLAGLTVRRATTTRA